MKVGLLICGEMPSALHRKGITYPNLLKKWLEPHLPKNTVYKPFRAFAGKLPNDIHACDCYFVSGSRASLIDNEPWMVELGKFMLVSAKAQVPAVGICFGHQLLAQALGGRVARAKNWGVGLHEWKVVREEGWMRESGKRLRLPVIHHDEVVKLPPRSVRIAASETCANGVFRVANHTIGMQGHPELPPDLVKKLIEHNIDDIGAETAAEAISSLTDAGDSERMGRWCAGFVSTRA